MSTKGQNGIGRRQFLKSASYALATAAVAPHLMAGTSSKPRSIVAGYAPLTAESSAPDTFAYNVLAADRLDSGDGTFIRTDARIRVHGISGGSLKDRKSREFVTHFSVDGRGKNLVVPFTAWRSGRVVDSNTPVSFNVPVNDHQKILFSVLGGETSAEGEETALPIELSLMSGGRTAKLNRGYYIIVPLFDNQAEPDWSSYSLRRNANTGRLALHDLSFGEPRAVVFEHFVIRVDYARPV